MVNVMWTAMYMQLACSTQHLHALLDLTVSTQPCILPGSLNRVPASAGAKAGKSPLVGWQVTLCDPIWHVISRSGVVKFHKLLYTVYLLTYLIK